MVLSGQNKVGTLTLRQKELVRYIGEGLDNKEISTSMGIEVGSVENHIRVCYDKLELYGSSFSKRLRAAKLVWEGLLGN